MKKKKEKEMEDALIKAVFFYRVIGRRVNIFYVFWIGCEHLPKYFPFCMYFFYLDAPEFIYFLFFSEN